jgi:hypothetical protein
LHAASRLDTGELTKPARMLANRLDDESRGVWENMGGGTAENIFKKHAEKFDTPPPKAYIYVVFIEHPIIEFYL